MKFLAMLIILIGSSANAHMVSYQGATSLMSYNEGAKNEYMLTYSYRPWGAVALTYLKEKSDENDFAMTIPRANFLLKRWNNDDSQANIYGSVGYGNEQSLNENKPVGLVAGDIDWESRKYYTSFQYSHLYRDSSSRPDLDMMKYRLGFAPYLAEFKELNTWFILQFSQQAREKIETTPLIRLFYQNVLIELGAGLNGKTTFNFMIHL